jgi:hypothetical protein
MTGINVIIKQSMKTKINLIDEIALLLRKTSECGSSYYLTVNDKVERKVIIRVSDHNGRKSYKENQDDVISFITKNVVPDNPLFQIPEIDKLPNEFVIDGEDMEIKIGNILDKFEIEADAVYRELLTPSLFTSKIEKKEANVLTLESARKIKGKRIAWMYYGDRANYLKVEEMVVGDIVSSLDYNETQVCEGFKSRSDYWRSYMTAKQLQREKDMLILLNADGTDSFIRCHMDGWKDFFNEPTFTCSDEDREVYYVIID